MASKEKARQPRTPEPVTPSPGGKDRATASPRDPSISASDQKRGMVAPGAHGDHASPLPDTGMDRDAGAGASGGHDRGGAEASSPSGGRSTSRR